MAITTRTCPRHHVDHPVNEWCPKCMSEAFDNPANGCCGPDKGMAPITPDHAAAEREALADLIYDDQREQCDLDQDGFYDCAQLADHILAAGYRRLPPDHAATIARLEASLAQSAKSIDYAMTAFHGMVALKDMEVSRANAAEKERDEAGKRAMAAEISMDSFRSERDRERARADAAEKEAHRLQSGLLDIAHATGCPTTKEHAVAVLHACRGPQSDVLRQDNEAHVARCYAAEANLAAAEKDLAHIREAWIAARHVVFVARLVAITWPGNPGCAPMDDLIDDLRKVVIAYDQRNHDAGGRGAGE